jgi:hypothetical protein
MTAYIEVYVCIGFKPKAIQDYDNNAKIPPFCAFC